MSVVLINPKREAARATAVRPLPLPGLIKVKALKMITILKDKKEIRTAVESGLVTRIKKNGQIYYKNINPHLLKSKS